MAGKTGMKIKKPNIDSPKHYEYYQNLHKDWTEEQCKEAAKKFKRSGNYQCIEYYERHYPNLSHEEHLKMMENIQNQKKSNNPNYIQYYEKRYPNLSYDELVLKLNEYKDSVNKFNIKYWETHYPELSSDEHELMRTSWIENYKENLPKMLGERNGMHKSKRTEQQLAENCPWKIEFYIKRNPELSLDECEELRQQMIKKTQNNVKYNNCQIEYYLAKGMTNDEAELALKERQATCRLDKFIKRYGEIEGFEKWNARQTKWKSSIQKSFVSQRGIKYIIQSKFALNIINTICAKLCIPIPENELALRDDDNAYLYDFYYENKIIEFNGDYWHANPQIYNETWYNASSKHTAKEIWEADKQKRKCAELNGYKILYIWESEYKTNPDETINKCLAFLKS